MGGKKILFLLALNFAFAGVSRASEQTTDNQKKIPEFAQKFKIGSSVVLVSNDTDYLAKVFGFVDHPEDPSKTQYVLKFGDGKYKDKIAGTYNKTALSLLYSEIKNMPETKMNSIFAKGDVVVVRQNNGTIAGVAKICGLYFYNDGTVRHMVEFVGGTLNGGIGSRWEQEHLTHLRNHDPHGEPKYLITKDNNVGILIGYLSETSILTADIDLENYQIMQTSDVRWVRTHDKIPLEP